MEYPSLNDIVRDGRQATRDELNWMFKQYVCETTCSRVIKMISDEEIKRILALHLFDMHVLQLNKNRGVVMIQLELVLGVSKTTMYRWFPAKDYKNITL